MLMSHLNEAMLQVSFRCYCSETLFSHMKHLLQMDTISSICQFTSWHLLLTRLVWYALKHVGCICEHLSTCIWKHYTATKGSNVDFRMCFWDPSEQWPRFLQAPCVTRVSIEVCVASFLSCTGLVWTIWGAGWRGEVEHGICKKWSGIDFQTTCNSCALAHHIEWWEKIPTAIWPSNCFLWTGQDPNEKLVEI